MKRYSVIIIRELRLKIILDLFLFLNKNTCKRIIGGCTLYMNKDKVEAIINSQQQAKIRGLSD